MRPKNFATRYYSDRQEKAVAKAVKGKQTANSGATPFVKGDVLSDVILIECKTHVEPKNSMSVKKDWIKKNREEAFQMGKPYSAVAIDFGDGEQHYIISDKMFLEFLDYVRGTVQE